MHTMSDAAEGREHSGHDEHQVSTDAEQLVTEHGEDADHVAAKRADSHFRDGDMLGGTRWLKIFRRIAMAHRRHPAD
jgi:hypothetical protein